MNLQRVCTCRPEITIAFWLTRRLMTTSSNITSRKPSGLGLFNRVSVKMRTTESFVAKPQSILGIDVLLLEQIFDGLAGDIQADA